ncbi:hypothetical protein D3C78_1018160 [compost metagenome]
MDAGQARRLHHRDRVEIAKAGDILADAAFEQLNVLRQIADIRSQFGALPTEDIGTVQTHLAMRGRPDPQQRPGQSRLARTARADEADRLASRDPESEPADHRLLGAGRRDHQGLGGEFALGRRQRHALGLGGDLHQQLVQALVLGARRGKALPRADHQIDRRQSPAQQDGTGDHQTGTDLLLERQIGSQPQDQRLHQQAEGLGQRRDRTRAIAGQPLQGQHPVVLRLPAPTELRQHAHRLHHLGVAQVLVGERRGGQVLLVRLLQHAIGQALVGPGQHHQHGRAEHAEPAEPGVEDEHHRQIDRQPGGIEEGEQAVAGEKLAQPGQIAERLCGGVHPP